MSAGSEAVAMQPSEGRQGMLSQEEIQQLLNSFDSNAEQHTGKKTTYDNLGKEVPYDKDNAERLQNGASEDAPDVTPEVPSMSDTVSEDLGEARTDIPANPAESVSEEAPLAPEGITEEAPDTAKPVSEEAPSTPESSTEEAPAAESAPEESAEAVEKGPEETPDEREKSRAEERLEVAKEKLNDIKQQMEELESQKEKLDEDIANCEELVEQKEEEYDKLLDRVDELNKEIKETKMNVIKGFRSGLEIAKNLILGRHDEAREIIDRIRENIDKNENALKERKETKEKLTENKKDRESLKSAIIDAKDNRDLCYKKISRLEKQKQRAEDRLELHKEEVADEAWAEAWKDAKNGIKAEMGNKNLSAYKRELKAEKQKQKEGMEEELLRIKWFKDPKSAVRQIIEATTREGVNIEDIVEKAETETRGRYDANVAKIDQKLEKVDQYFPSWTKRINSISENHLVRDGLQKIKRRCLLRLYGIA